MSTEIMIKTNVFFSFLCVSPLSLSLSRSPADGRLNTGHAGVLLAGRRGSYPLIDLRILKSGFSHFNFIV
uniref:Secreted protein n=1 Tax=Salarias fasciatus TaxID=181472 RepID=A0A672FWA2_SALFA